MKKVFAIADIRLPDEQRIKLTELGFTPVLLPPSEKLGAAVASHPDMLLFIGEDRIITEGDYYLQNRALLDSLSLRTKRRIIISKSKFKKDYPSDAGFNAGKAGDMLFIKSDTAAKEILEYAELCGLSVISTKQGYPACTVLYLGENFAITSDKGMAKLMENQGVLTTFIDNSSVISLPPHEYGFIGGCAGIYKDTVYFTGNIEAHPCCEAIEKAISEAGFKFVSLGTCDLLFDLGGLRFIEEAID